MLKKGEIKAHLNSSRVLTQNELDGISKDLSNTIGSTIKLDYNVDEFNWWFKNTTR